MANVEHVDIEDPNIHEPKGVADATDGQVYVADGAGSGEWTTLDLGDADPFGARLLHVREERSSGTTAALTANTWNTRTLQTVKTNEITGASLSSNRITLPTGTYFIDASVPVLGPEEEGGTFHRSKLYNVTGTADLVVGTLEKVGCMFYVDGEDIESQETQVTRSFVKGRFTLASQSNLEIRTYVDASTSTYSYLEGSTNDIHTDVLIWKVG